VHIEKEEEEEEEKEKPVSDHGKILLYAAEREEGIELSRIRQFHSIKIPLTDKYTQSKCPELCQKTK
jgi:hypothetical protein